MASIHPEFYDGKGVSAIIVNTEKGMEAWNNVKENLEYIKTNLDSIKKYNSNLVEPTHRKDIRNDIYNDLDKKDFKKFYIENLKFKKTLKDIIRSKFSDEDVQKIKRKLKSFK